MTKPVSFSSLDFQLVSSLANAHGEVEPDTPFRVLVMGDFSGRAHRETLSQPVPMDKRHLHLVDRDTLEDVMAAIAPEVRLPLMGNETPATVIRITELDDFHPDRLHERLDIFWKLREGRCKPVDNGLRNGGRDGGKAASNDATAQLSPTDVVSTVVGQSTGSLLDLMLDEAEGVRPAVAPGSEWDRYLSEIVRPHLVSDNDSADAQRSGDLDEAVSELMRAILHYPDFQELEALWRGVAFLTSRLETGEEIELFLLDVTKRELAGDLCGNEELRESCCYQRIVASSVKTPGAVPWALLAGLYTFDRSRDDVTLLARLSQLAASAGAPFVGAASERIVGCDSLATTSDPREWQSGTDDEALLWAALRRISTANYLGLAVPRFLLRLPYGVATDSVDAFDFEEQSIPPEHEGYLWGNPALAVVSLLGETFSQMGWGMRPGVVQDVENLPLHVYKEQGESIAKPCAEILVSSDTAELLMEWGFMPLVSFKDQDKARLARFSSLADPPTALAGRWGVGD